MQTIVYDLKNHHEAEFVRYERDGALYTGVVLKSPDRGEYTLPRLNPCGPNGFTYPCSRVVDHEWLDSCTDGWTPAYLYTPAPKGYAFVHYRYHGELGMNHTALRKLSDEEVEAIQDSWIGMSEED